MKKLLFAVCALAAISLLAPSAGYAQWENRIGIYSAPDAFAGTTHAYIESPALFTPFNIYFVLTNPMHEGAPVTELDAFEFVVGWESTTGLTKLGDTYPGDALNIDNGWGYAVGFAAPLSVTGGQVLLCTTQVLLLSGGPFYAHMQPATKQSLPDVMAYNLPAGILVAATPSSGTFDDEFPDFALGSLTVGEENATFGGVKALFR